MDDALLTAFLQMTLVDERFVAYEFYPAQYLPGA